MDKGNVYGLVKKASRRNKRAFAALCELKVNEVLFLCTREMGNVQDAQDATQEVFIRMQQSIVNLKAPEAFNVWLNRLVHYTCLNMKRDSMKDKNALKTEAFEDFLFEEDQALLPQEYLEKEENRQRIVAFIDELPESYRECVVLHYYQNLTYAQIAQVLGVSFDNVNNNMRMARLYLKRRMEKDAAQTSPAGQVTMFAMGAVLSGSLMQTAAATASAATAHQCLVLAGVYTAFAGGGLLGGIAATSAGKAVAGALAVTVLAAGGAGVAQYVAGNPSRSSESAVVASQPVGQPQSPQEAAPGVGYEDIPVPVVQNTLSGRVHVKPGAEADPSAYTGIDGIRLELVDAAEPDKVVAETVTQGGEANGSFQLAGMADGEYMLRVWLPQNAKLISGGEEVQSKAWRSSNMREVTVVKDGDTLLQMTGNATSIEGLDIQVDIPAKVDGRIQLYLNKTDIPYDEGMLPGVYIQLLDPQGRQVGRADIHADGSYEFTQPMICQQGSYTLRVISEESAPVELSIPDAEIEMEPGYGL